MALTETDLSKINGVVARMRESRRLFVITGAGISADSGLPTYRGVTGLYTTGTTEEGISIEEALSGDTLDLNPALSWKYIAQLEEKCRGASFNRGHEVIAGMEPEFESVTVLTQNIDGFHHAAGSTSVIDIHGDIHNLMCTACGWRDEVADYAGLDIPPVCPSCGEIVRPDVVLFGEMLPYDKLDLIMDAWDSGVDMVFSIGTTSVFPYIAQPVVHANRRRIPTVEINPGDTEVSMYIDYHIRAGAAEALDEIWRRYIGASS